MIRPSLALRSSMALLPFRRSHKSIPRGTGMLLCNLAFTRHRYLFQHMFHSAYIFPFCCIGEADWVVSSAMRKESRERRAGGLIYDCLPSFIIIIIISIQYDALAFFCLHSSIYLFGEWSLWIWLCELVRVSVACYDTFAILNTRFLLQFEVTSISHLFSFQLQCIP